MTSASRVRLYWETIRRLRPVQLYGRLWFAIHRPRPDERPGPPMRAATGTWRPPARRSASLVGPGRLTLLNETRDLDESGWSGAGASDLWRYNLHYFDDLNALGAGNRTPWHRDLIDRWVRENPPAGGVGWAPYPVSLRLVNWVKWTLADNPLSPTAAQSAAVQARWLARRMEWHLLGNHLFANAKALVFVGARFSGSEADSWVKLGMDILAREVPEQILPDGGQFELSPMYHALAFEDVLDLVNLATAFPEVFAGRRRQVDDWRGRLGPMRDWMRTMRHPDGGIAFFNDAALGVAPGCEELEAYATRLGLAEAPPARTPVHLADSGYVRLEGGEAVALVDVGHIGPDYIPGHAHADTLSFELSIGDRRVFVNTGTSVYGNGPERLRQRGTASHNTVVVGGADSSEVWGGFRVARRARPAQVEVRTDDGAQTVSATHDGYRRLRGGGLHRRRLRLEATAVTIEDEVEGRLPAEARFHLHPEVRYEGGVIRLPDGRTLTIDATGGALRAEPSTWRPEFGLSIPGQCLVLPLRDGRSRLRLSWG